MIPLVCGVAGLAMVLVALGVGDKSGDFHWATPVLIVAGVALIVVGSMFTPSGHLKRPIVVDAEPVVIEPSTGGVGNAD
jgi:hypothetical protein